MVQQSHSHSYDLIIGHIGTIDVDCHEQSTCVTAHFCTIIVRCRSADTSDLVTPDRKTGYIELTATDGLVGFTFSTYAKRQSVSFNFIKIKSPYRVTA